MKPVVLVTRSSPGDAFHYTRFAPQGRVRGPSTHELHLDPVPVGTALPVLTPADVEWFRNDPERFLA